jgi:prenylcysteine oxidase / farnesylcysteine lyase
MKLGNTLYYVNGFELFISTMETETVASRGVVDLMLRDLVGDGICPSGISAPPPEGVEFVWGWDC